MYLNLIKERKIFIYETDAKQGYLINSELPLLIRAGKNPEFKLLFRNRRPRLGRPGRWQLRTTATMAATTWPGRCSALPLKPHDGARVRRVADRISLSAGT